MALETFSIRFFFGNCKPRTAVCGYALAVSRWPYFNVDSNFNKALFVWWHHVVFRQVAVLHFNLVKNIKNSLIWVQTSNWQITGGCRNLSLAFKREAVQFLIAKNLAINHFLLEALAAFQDCGHVTFSGLPLTMKNLMVKSLSLTKWTR